MKCFLITILVFIVTACGSEYTPMSDEEIAEKVAHCRNLGLNWERTRILANGKLYTRDVYCKP